MAIRYAYLQIVVLSVILIGLSTNAAVLHVPSDYATIQDAINSSATADTILIAPGTYSGVGFANLDFSGASLLVRGSSTAESTIVLLDLGYFCSAYEDSPFHVIIENLTLKQGNPAIGAAQWSYTKLSNCRLIDNITAFVDTADMGGYTHIVDSCYFSGNGEAIYIYLETYLYVSNCVFEGNSVAIFAIRGYNSTFSKNVFVGNSFAVYCSAGSAFISFFDNVVAHNMIGVRDDWGGGYSLNMQCNNVSRNTDDYWGYPDQTGLNGNISEDPMFCDTTFASFDVSSLSPLLPQHNSCGVNIGNVSIGCYCGDVDTSGQIDIADLTLLVEYMFLGGPPPDPLEAADMNGDGVNDVTDVTYLVDYLFLGGPAPVC